MVRVWLENEGQKQWSGDSPAYIYRNRLGKVLRLIGFFSPPLPTARTFNLLQQTKVCHLVTRTCTDEAAFYWSRLAVA